MLIPDCICSTSVKLLCAAAVSVLLNVHVPCALSGGRERERERERERTTQRRGEIPSCIQLVAKVLAGT